MYVKQWWKDVNVRLKTDVYNAHILRPTYVWLFECKNIWQTTVKIENKQMNETHQFKEWSNHDKGESK